MALIHPTDRVHTISSEHKPRDRKPLHPAIGLAGGFGLIILATVVVHTTFGVIL